MDKKNENEELETSTQTSYVRDKKSQESLWVAVIVVIATMAFIGGFAIADDIRERIFRATDSKETTVDNELISTAGGSLTGNTLGFDEKYIVSDNNNKYSIILDTYTGMDNTFVNIEYGEKQTQLKFIKHSYESDENQEFVIDFPAKVVDIHTSTFDLDSELNTVFILLENGKVEYILMEDAITRNEIKSYGTLELEKVVKFYEGTSCETETDYCVKTAFAQTMNGKIYDLINYVR